jgi:hypothetical protein
MLRAGDREGIPLALSTVLPREAVPCCALTVWAGWFSHRRINSHVLARI